MDETLVVWGIIICIFSILAAAFYLYKGIQNLRSYDEIVDRPLTVKREYYDGISAEIDHCIKECENINLVIREKINPALQLHKSGFQKINVLEDRISAYPVVHDKLLNDVKTLKDWFNAQQQLIRDLEEKLQFFKEVNTNIIGRLEKQDSEIDAIKNAHPIQAHLTNDFRINVHGELVNIHKELASIWKEIAPLAIHEPKKESREEKDA